MLKSNWNEQVDEVGQKNTVLTLYELTQGDLTRGTGIEASLFFLSFPSQPLSTHLVVLYLLHPHPLLSSDDPLQHDPSQSNTATHSYPRPCTELHELDQEVLQKALAVLVKRGKAQVFGSDDRLGVKFF